MARLPPYPLPLTLDPRPAPNPADVTSSLHQLLVDAYTGKDITRPRDLYTFLSIGHIPDVPAFPRKLLRSRSVHAIRPKRVTFEKEESFHRRKSLGEDASSYVHFDLQHNPPLLPLPAIKTDFLIDPEENNDQDNPDNEAEKDDVSESDSIPKIPISLLRGYHKVNISTTYIFAPDERLTETVKYNPKAILPQISPRKKPKHPRKDQRQCSSNQSNSSSVLSLEIGGTNQSSAESSPRKKYEIVNTTPRRQSNKSVEPIFGVRPECLFIENQLGDKNPLVRDPARSKMSQEMPTKSGGAGMLQDLKDYSGYPDIYWKLRADTVAQPNDLEADMIDRDLYRLRQISTLKLNTVERTFQVKQDPFRKWRGKAGEALFSPKQQKRTVPRQKLTKSKGLVGSHYSVGLPPKVKVTSLKLSDPSSKEKPPEAVTSSPLHHDNNSPAGNLEQLMINATSPGLGATDTSGQPTARHGTIKEEVDPVSITPREAVAASLDAYHRHQRGRESEENLNFGKISVEKLHQNKKKRQKQTVKTTLVRVDLATVDQYNNNNNNRPQRKGLLHPMKYRQPQQNGHSSVSGHALAGHEPDSNHAPGQGEQVTLKEGQGHNPEDGHETAGGEETSWPAGSALDAPAGAAGGGGVDKASSKAASTTAGVATILFDPPTAARTMTHCSLLEPMASTFVYGPSTIGPVEESGDERSVIIQNTHPTPEGSLAGNVSQKGGGLGGGVVNGNPSQQPIKTHHLEVFSERKESLKPIKIPTGRTTYHPGMPAYRLDLVNYPPSNARQSCGRSNSAGPPDSRQTALTAATLQSQNRPFSSRHAHSTRPLSSRHTHTSMTANVELARMPRSADSAGVNIRFAGQGEVILTSSSKEKRAGAVTSR
ncbi:uncharacterized protein LOC101851245 [Aplysia californica]|uniref:Uncharacterized protein LOC101851245 n=1 Tax=Aplysia californica TaxID=6500 RepID=A0ABM0JEX8_APLCA|nr:uncharacterized protein LOC101851245 [Aplysia californica]